MIITETDSSKSRSLIPRGVLKSLPNHIPSLSTIVLLLSHHLFSPCHLQWFHSCFHLISSLHHTQAALLKYKLAVITFLLTNCQRFPVALECKTKFIVLRALCMQAKSLDSLWPCGVFQATLSEGFSRQDHQSGLLRLPPGDLPDSGTDPSLLGLLHWQRVLSL